MIDSNFAMIGVIISSIGGFTYLTETIKGRVKPNKVTWFLWALAPLIVFTAQVQKGVGIQAIFTFMSGFLPLLICIYSICNKKSEWKITRFDIFCGLISLSAIYFWQVTHEANLAILFAIIADGFAGIPTLVKAYKSPETENSLSYLLNVIGVMIILFTIPQWSFMYYAFPLYFLLLCFSLFFIISFRIGLSIYKRKLATIDAT